jgi:predicted Zn-dependent peptidase
MIIYLLFPLNNYFAFHYNRDVLNLKYKFKTMIQHKKELLSNKMPLISVPIVGAPTATALVMIKTGSKYESKAESGLSHFLEHMFFKGTEKRPDTLAISSALDALGGEFNAFTSKEYTGYYVKVSAGKLVPALEVLGDMLANSKFEEIEIEREKGVIIEELNMYEDNPLMHIEDVLEACLYGNSPAGWDTIGTKETIKSFKRENFVKYFQKQYGANSMGLILSGAITKTEKKAATDLFAGFRRNKWQDKQKVQEKQVKPALKIVYKKTDQVNLALAVRSFPVSHPQEMALKLLSVILGGSMSSRLFISLRERSGLAYYVKTGAEFYSDTGYLSTQAGVPKDKLVAALKIIMDEYRLIAKEAVSKEELKRAKDIVSGRLAMQLESSDEIASWYGKQFILRDKYFNPQEIEKKLKAVSAKDIQAVAKLIMKDKNLNLAVIGPLKENNNLALLKLLKF